MVLKFHCTAAGQGDHAIAFIAGIGMAGAAGIEEGHIAAFFKNGMMGMAKQAHICTAAAHSLFHIIQAVFNVMDMTMGIVK